MDVFVALGLGRFCSGIYRGFILKSLKVASQVILLLFIFTRNFNNNNKTSKVIEINEFIFLTYHLIRHESITHPTLALTNQIDIY